MFRQSLEKKMLDMEKYVESFKETIFQKFEKQEENFNNKMKSFDLTLKEHTNRLSHLEDRGNTDENESIELQQVKNSNYLLFFDLYKI